jgi:hypothetical protein
MRVNSGADFQAGVMSSTSSNGTAAYAPANYVALTTDTTAPAATDTTLPSELNNSGGGLNRAQATYAHTAGTASYTLTKTYTMNTNDGSSVQPAKIGVYNGAYGASPTPLLVFETAIPNPPTMVPGDQLTLTETVNI